MNGSDRTNRTPVVVESQVQGSILDGLGTLMIAELDVRRGRVVQGNFTRYPLLRFPDAAPRVGPLLAVVAAAQCIASGAGRLFHNA